MVNSDLTKNSSLSSGCRMSAVFVVFYQDGWYVCTHFLLLVQFTYRINGSDTIIMCDTRSHHIGVYCMNRRDLAERMHGDVGREL